MHIAFIGFGEVGQTFSRGLLATGKVSISAYDILYGSNVNCIPAQRAREIGVRFAPTAREAVAGADVVFSAVTASEAETVAAGAADFLKPGQMFLDVNSAAPTTKQRAGLAVAASGADYVECAVMAPVLKPGIRVPILTGGAKADAASALMNALGMDMTPVATELGLASATKLCRSIIIKGLEALMVDCTAACEQWGVKDTVFASFAKTFPSIDWHALSADMKERVATHGVRRAAEMREAAEMVAALGMNPDLVAAVAEAQQRGAKPKTQG